MSSAPAREPRIPLTRERVFAAAIAVADEGGLEALTMRRLASGLGVEAMSLYHHVANKEALLDGVAETVMEEIIDSVDSLPTPPEVDWKTAARRRILASRQVLLAHKWAPEVLESRSNMSAAVIRYHDGLLDIFRAGGFSWDLAHHALHALGSRALGFSQELFQPDPEDGDEMDEEMVAAMSQMFPNIGAMLADVAHDDPDSTLGWCDDQSEFEFGLDLLLDGLERINRGG